MNGETYEQKMKKWMKARNKALKKRVRIRAGSPIWWFGVIIGASLMALIMYVLYIMTYIILA